MTDNNGREHVPKGQPTGGQFVAQNTYNSQDRIKALSSKIFGKGKFVKTGETVLTEPEERNEVFRGSDKYPQAISQYEFVKAKSGNTIEIDLNAEIQKQFDNASPKERTKIAFNFIKNKLRGKYQTKNGLEVFIQKSSANKISHTLFEPKIRTSPQLVGTIKAGEFYKTEKAEHKLFNRFAYYNVKIKIKDKTYTAMLNIGINGQNEAVLYDINNFTEQ